MTGLTKDPSGVVVAIAAALLVALGVAVWLGQGKSSGKQGDPTLLLRSPDGLDFSLVGKTSAEFRQACSRSGGRFEDAPFQGGAVCHMDSDDYLQIGVTYVNARIYIVNRRYQGQGMYSTLLDAVRSAHGKPVASGSDVHKPGCAGFTWRAEDYLIVLETCPDATHLSVGRSD